MRKVLFKRFAYEDDNRVRVFIDEREGYFHGLHIEGGGHDYAVIEDCETGENYQVEPCNYKFIPSDEKESIDWEQRRYEIAKEALQAIITGVFSNKEAAKAMLDTTKKNGLQSNEAESIMAIEYADELINQLKNTPMK